MKQNKLRIIGITGGIGTGKTQVMNCLAARDGAVCLEADALAKELYLPGRRAYQPVIDMFGKDILDENGYVDRSRLAGIVFSDPDALDTLNRLIHPLVKEEIRERIAEAGAKKKKYFFLEAALLLQDGYDKICDEIWYIFAEREVRLRRLMAGRGIDREKAVRVMANQPEESWYRERADHVIDNSGDFANTKKQIDCILKV